MSKDILAGIHAVEAAMKHDAGNVVEIMAQPDVDGALVGGASLNADEFAKIVMHYSAIV